MERQVSGWGGLWPRADMWDAYDYLPYVMVMMDQDGVYRKVNRATLTLFGFDPAGMHRDEVATCLRARFADGRPLTEENMPSSRTLLGEAVPEFEYMITDKDGLDHWLLMSAVPLVEDGQVTGALISHKDITQRKLAEDVSRKNEARFRLLARTSSALLAANEPRLVVRDLCVEVMEHLDCQVFFSFRADGARGRLKLLAWAGISSEDAALLEWLDYGAGFCGAVARDREMIVAQDIQGGFDPRTDIIRAFGVEAYCCHPLLGRDGVLLGTLSFGTRNRSSFAKDEIDLMKAVSDLVAMAIQRDRERSVLARSEARMKLLIEHAPAAIAVFDRRLRYVSVSRRWIEDHGLAGRNILGLSLFELFPSISDEWREVLERGLSGEVIRDDSEPFHRASGSIERIRWEVRPWFDEAGAVAGVAIFTEDISKDAAAKEALALALNQLNRHMENTPLAVVEWDADFNVTRWAGAAERIFGWSPEEVVGRNIGELNLVYEEDIPKVGRLMSGMLTGRNPSNMNANRNYRKDGSLISCEWYNSTLYDDSGNIRSTLSLVLDVTRRDLLERELLVAKEAAESASRAKSAFLAHTSHELRTPLNGVIGMIELALRQEPSTRARTNLELAKQASMALLDIINDILDLARIEAGRVELACEPFDLGETLAYLAEFFGAGASRKGLALKVEAAVNLPGRLLGDEGRLRQVLVNLLGNAVKFTSHGGISLKVSDGGAPSSPGRTRLLFSVEDTGIGIAPDLIGSLFESFSPSTATTHVKYGGTGLGLSISRQLVALMGGEISVSSEPGRGSVFAFWAEFGEAPPHADESVGKTSRRGETPPSRLRILLAEDNEINRLFMKSVIEEEGHEVVTACDGSEALAALAGGGFDLVLMDVQMPVMDGLQATRAVRSGGVAGCPSEIPIVALTAHAFAEDRERFLAAGMNECFSKPVNLEEMDRLLESWSAKKFLEGGGERGVPPRPVGMERAGKRIDELLGRLPGEKVWALIAQAQESITAAMELIGALLAEGRAEEVAFEVHRLRGTLTVVVGTDRMIELSLALEKLASAGNLSGTVEIMEDLREEVRRLGDFLDSQWP